MSSPGRSPARRGHLPNLKSPGSQTISPYRKAAGARAAESVRGSQSWKSVALPDIPGMSGPAGPAGPVDGPVSPDPMFQAKESKALQAWVQAAQNGDAEAQNNLGVSYYRGINGVQKVHESSPSYAQRTFYCTACSSRRTSPFSDDRPANRAACEVGGVFVSAIWPVCPCLLVCARNMLLTALDCVAMAER